MAHHLHNRNISERSDSYIRENFVTFSKSDEFLNLSHSCLKDIISKNDLKVTNEEVVFEAVLKWVKASPAERQDKLPELLSEVRMIYLPRDYLAERVVSEELFSTSVASRDLVEKVKTCHFKSSDISECLCFKTVPRNYNMKHILYAVSENQPSGLTINTHNFIHNAWYYLSSFQCTEDVLQVTATNNKIFIFLDRKLGIFHLENVQWELLEAEHEKIGGTAVVFLENIIYFFGSSYDCASDRIRRFDTQQNKWLEEKQMKSGRCYPAAASLGKYIVITGGYSGRLSSNLDSAEKYNPSTDEWSEISSMLTPRFSHRCINVEDKIYACGGFDKISQLNTAEIYDPVINQWKFISPMKTARQFFSLISYNSKIYAIGGLTEGYHVTRDTEIYDPESDQWDSGLPAPAGFEFAVSVPTTTKQNVHQSGHVSEKSPNVH